MEKNLIAPNPKGSSEIFERYRAERKAKEQARQKAIQIRKRIRSKRKRVQWYLENDLEIKYLRK